MKKRILLALLIAVSFLSTQAQKKEQNSFLNIGLKAGLNYGNNGEISFKNLEAQAEDLITSEGAKDQVGYHLGLFLRVNLTKSLFIRPEIQFTQNSSKFDKSQTKYTLDKIDLPLLIGTKIAGPVYVMAGPSLQYITKNKLENIAISSVKNEFSVGFQVGTGIQLGRFNADIRYEKGFSDNQAKAIKSFGTLQNLATQLDTEVRVDARPSQFIIGIGLDL